MTGPYDLAAPPRQPDTLAHEPSVTYSLVRRGELTWMLLIVRSFWRNEGSCIVESSDGRTTKHVENGEWRLKSGDDLVRVLDIELPDGEIDDDVLDELQAGLVDKGFADSFNVRGG